MIKTDEIAYVFRNNHFYECKIIDIIEDGFIADNNPFNKFKLVILDKKNFLGIGFEKEIIVYRYEILHDSDIENFLQQRIKEIRKKRNPSFNIEK